MAGRNRKPRRVDGFKECLEIYPLDYRPPIIPGWSEKLVKWRLSKGLGESWNIHQLQRAGKVGLYD